MSTVVNHWDALVKCYGEVRLSMKGVPVEDLEGFVAVLRAAMTGEGED